MKNLLNLPFPFGPSRFQRQQFQVFILQCKNIIIKIKFKIKIVNKMKMKISEIEKYLHIIILYKLMETD